MKFLVLALVVISAVAVLGNDEEDWLDFKLQFGKLFLSPGKEEQRKQAFKQNKAVHDQLVAASEAGEIAYTPQIYEFHDLTAEELRTRLTGVEVVPTAHVRKLAPALRQKHERTYDMKKWNDPARHQRTCGSCWTFSTINAIEVAYALKKNNEHIDLSEQHLVDCAKRDSYDRIQDGCKGGWMPSAMNWLAKNGGAVLEKSYPYQNQFQVGACKTGIPAAVQISGYVQVANDADSIKAAIKKYGSLPIAVDADQWNHYGTGIFSATSVAATVNHAVNLVGWGYDEALRKDFWLVRNSWGTQWGENGYIRLSTDKSGTYFTEHTFAVLIK